MQTFEQTYKTLNSWDNTGMLARQFAWEHSCDNVKRRTREDMQMYNAENMMQNRNAQDAAVK